MTAFYHVCFVVPDLEDAMRDFGLAAGVGWAAPVAGSPWDGTGGARFDHLGFWTSDVERGSRRLREHGMPEEFSGCPFGRPFVYHRVDSAGTRIELVDAGQQAGFLDAWFPGGAAMPVIEEGGPA